jgi:hypothetical protein
LWGPSQKIVLSGWIQGVEGSRIQGHSISDSLKLGISSVNSVCAFTEYLKLPKRRWIRSDTAAKGKGGLGY